jgi:Zn-finger nucleic acid-binding protein
VDLIETDRLGVKARCCPECDGEWFARGAVDRLLERAGGPDAAGPTAPAVAAPSGARREDVWNWF